MVVALAFVAGATQIQTSFLVDPVGPKTFPMLVGGVAALCALLIILKPDAEPDWPGVKTFFGIGLATLTLVAYAYTLKPLGFLVPTAVAASMLSYQIRPHKLAALITGPALSAGLYITFKYALGLGLVALPKSWLG
jgi:putative tricarboxylic transport membrane protein